MFKRLLFLLSVPLLIYGDKVLVPRKVPADLGPWFTGPLLTPSGHVVPVGHQNYNPYVYWTTDKGVYNKHWSSQPTPHFKAAFVQTSLQFGIFPRTELDLNPSFTYNTIQGVHDWRFSDFPFTVDIALLRDTPEDWNPAIKLRLGANIPFGKYDRLDPNKRFTDVGGLGNWLPSVGIVLTRVFHFGNFNFLAWRFFVEYAFSTGVPVHGLSVYGGAPTIDGVKGTRGTVYPGDVLTVQQGLEYSITHNWALALDLAYQYNTKTRFSGRTPSGTKPTAPCAQQFSIATGLEYNFNANVGIIAGPWFTVAGKNSNLTFDFISWIFAINIYN